MTIPTPRNDPGAVAWNALTYFNFYRFLVAFLFAALVWIGQLPDPLGIYDQNLFSISVHLYLFFSIGAQFFVRLRTPPYNYQVVIQVTADIVFISLMMYASAGLNSGFGMLLIIAVAGGGLLSSGKIGILYAAMATIAVLGQEVYAQLNRIDYPFNYTHAGILGITFFVTAFISQLLASRVYESEALAERRGADLQKLAQLNESIVQRLQSGILVIDEKLSIHLLNKSAQLLLGIGNDVDNIHIVELVPELANNVNKWKTGLGERSIIVRSARAGIDLQASFIPLNLEEGFQILIFLDDVAKLRQQAQQMKLASLGRLTASIAHEVRNPLGAISHAGQLLSESNSLNQEDKRLTAIIAEHSGRVNNIIENIMSISRREQPVPVIIELTSWLKEFTDEFESTHGLQTGAVGLSNGSDEILARMDPTQLYQILWNLLENGIRYSTGMPMININCAISAETQRPYVDIIDHGTGITPDSEEHLFEPFFTTETQGTGLGLFIARELCEANQASLNLYKNTREGCCFRISFSYPDKQHAIM